MKHYNKQKALYLQLSCRSFGMLVDTNGCPPSERGLVRHMQREGLLKKIRETRGKRSFRSAMKITEAGLNWLRKRKPDFLAWGLDKNEYQEILAQKAA